MKDTEASVGLIRQFDRDLQEFLDTHDPADFATLDEIGRAFVAFMREKKERRKSKRKDQHESNSQAN